MKIAIVAPSGVPYAVGGAEKLWWGLLDALRRYTDHEIELIKIPSPERSFAEVLTSYRYFSELNLNHFDLVISTKYPAWMVRHSNHYVYLQHTLRGLYDSYPHEHLPTELAEWPEPLLRLQSLLGETPSPDLRAAIFDEIEHLQKQPEWRQWFEFPGPLARQVIHWFDRSALAPGRVNKFMAISHNVAGRANYFPAGVPIQVIHHPSDLEPDLEPETSLPGDYLFTVSRLDAPKRLDLLLHAMRRTDADIELRIAGAGPDRQRLRKLAADDERIQFLGRLSDAELQQQYAGALAVAFVPADEDYGLVTVEALQAGKPVLSCTDSGGVEELVTQDQTGWLCQPHPTALAAQIKRLAEHPDQARAMATACRRRGEQINWPSTIHALLDGSSLLDNDGYLQRGKPGHIVVAVTFPVFPPRSGGQNRIYHLYRHIAYFTPVTLVTLCSHSMEAGEQEIAPGLTEICIPKSAAHERGEAALERELGASVGDIYAIEHIGQSPAYLEALKRACLTADLAIASHPFLYPAIKAVYRGPVLYESHNVELDMKTTLLQGSSKAADWLQQTRRVEQACCDDSLAVAACSSEDAARLQALYQLASDKVRVIANGVNIGTTPLSSAEKRRMRRRLHIGDQPIALFMGSWHGPNIEAAHFLLDELAAVLPAIEYWIIGSVCREFIERKNPANIRLWGEISEADKQALLSVADVALNPVDAGGGSNLKMAEYAVASMPVISTPHGCRGLALEPEKHVFVAEKPEFEKKLRHVVNQLGSEALEHMLAAAYNAAVGNHDWSRIAQDYYGQIVEVGAREKRPD